MDNIRRSEIDTLKSMEDMHKLLLEYDSFLKNYSLKLCRNEHDAEDLVSATTYRALKNFTKYNEKLAFKARIGTVMYNIFVDGYRSKKPTCSIDLLYNLSTDDTDGEWVLMKEEIFEILDQVEKGSVEMLKDSISGYSYKDLIKKYNVEMKDVKKGIYEARIDVKKKLTSLGYRQNNKKKS